MENERTDGQLFINIFAHSARNVYMLRFFFSRQEFNNRVGFNLHWSLRVLLTLRKPTNKTITQQHFNSSLVMFAEKLVGAKLPSEFRSPRQWTFSYKKKWNTKYGHVSCIIQTGKFCVFVPLVEHLIINLPLFFLSQRVFLFLGAMGEMNSFCSLLFRIICCLVPFALITGVNNLRGVEGMVTSGILDRIGVIKVA